MNLPGADGSGRRAFIEKSMQLVTAVGLIGATGLLSACNKQEEARKEEGDEEKEVSPPEDLMQEHGLLNRVLLIYDTCRIRLVNKTDFPMEELYNGASIIKTFIEEYHEKQEEDFLFPRFEKARSMTALVQVLRKQHDAGRVITSRLMALSKQRTLSENETQEMVSLLAAFNNMYRPHEAREDTVLFPAFRKIVSKHEYDSLGEEFEKNEHKKFGEDGFDMMVRRVENIESKLGINNLDQFTPEV